MIKLTDLKSGELAVIVSITDNQLASKMVSMGLAVSHSVEIIRQLWFGRTFYIKSDYLILAVTKNEADSILIERA